MGQVATVTIGTASYSVYALSPDPLADANTYHAGNLGTTTWDAADSATKRKALVMAVRMIDRVSSWSGEETVPGQPLAWPRDGASCDGEALPDNTVPDELALAEFELAALLLADPTLVQGSGTGSNIKSVGAGPAQVSFFSATVGTSRDTRLPQIVHDMVKCLFGGTDGVGTATASGVDQCSDFDPDDYERSEGFA